MFYFSSNNINEIYFRFLKEILIKGRAVAGTKEICSPTKGDSFIEISPAIATLTNSRNRCISLRQTDIFNLVGSWFWLLRGTTNLDEIIFYNLLASNFVDDNSGQLYGSWGSRIIPHIDKIKDVLEESSTSRRAVIPIFINNDVGYLSKNLPCLSSIQFLLRNNILDCSILMRSSNIYGVFPYDIFILTMLHEYMSLILGVSLGNFHFISNSAHIYDESIDVVNTLVNSDITKPVSMVNMPQHNLKFILDVEDKIRHGKISLEGILDLDIPLYFKDLLLVTYKKYLLINNKGLVRIGDLMEYNPLKNLMCKIENKVI